MIMMFMMPNEKFCNFKAVLSMLLVHTVYMLLCGFEKAKFHCLCGFNKSARVLT